MSHVTITEQGTSVTVTEEAGSKVVTIATPGPQGAPGPKGDPGATDYSELLNLPTLGTAAATDATDYATATQGAKADTAVQPAAIADFETGTELNTRDTANRSRSNHTGTQTAATITDFDTEVSSNTDVSANTTARHTHTNTAVLNATTAPFTTADETKLDAISPGATANATDAQLRDRATHTGSQAIGTVTGLQTALDGKQATGDYATNTSLTTHTSNTSNPHSVTKAQVGLGSVDNTSDVNKPVSTAQQTALNLKANTTEATRRYSFEPGADWEEEWRRVWIKLVTLDGIAANQGAGAQFLLTGTGDIGAAARGTYLVHIAQRGINGINVGAWGWDHNKTADPIEFYTKRISNFVFELWAKTAIWNSTHDLHMLGGKNTTVNLNSQTFTAPTGLSSIYPVNDFNTLPIQGSSSPNGVVSATVGTIYIDRNATGGAITWSKASGTGNTGWVRLDGKVQGVGLSTITVSSSAPTGAVANDLWVDIS